MANNPCISTILWLNQATDALFKKMLKLCIGKCPSVSPLAERKQVWCLGLFESRKDNVNHIGHIDKENTDDYI